MYEYKVIKGYTEAYEKTDVCLEDELNAWAKDGYRFVANLTFHKHATRRVLLMERSTVQFGPTLDAETLKHMLLHDEVADAD